MIHKVVLAFDSFKGSLSSLEVAEAARTAIAEIAPECLVETIAIADGGEGTSQAIAHCYGTEAQKVNCRVANPLMRYIDATYFIIENLAIIEMAAASGLTLLGIEERNPMLTTSFGTGQMIADALNRGCRNFLIGLDGSATNDAAIGALSALGFRFLDSQGSPVDPIGKNLLNITTIDDNLADSRLAESTFTIACDVKNPFYGPMGAACIFAPQKGANELQVRYLDDGLRNFAEVLHKFSCLNFSATNGAGAAGGMGGSFQALLNARLRSGIDIVLDYARFDEKIADADVIFTGEGSIDRQSGMGKALQGIISHANAHNVPVIAIAGSITNVKDINDAGAKAVFSIQNRPMSLAEAMNPETARNGIRTTVSQIMLMIS